MKIQTAVAYCTLALALALAPAAHADVASSQQGLHQWPVLKGKLLMVAGTVSDVLRYKRSMTFYFEAKPGADWIHVPIVKSQDDQQDTWFNVSHGETTMVDGFVAARGGDVYLIEAAVSESPAGIKANWYKLTTDDPAYPDGPFYLLKPVGQKFYANSKDLTVESVLKKEAAVKPESRVKR
ncbi:hypothetical protein [Rugamonas aquatica]|uniref:Uncharacterized protein n=1 Tax=Rugamonas aquatica TaxID=2743357 RepID=A0A6A7MUX0_9BURK|nr:hypothetical protein [Rugamonas aquatica]MQA36753.1 hypothetical protein [Rugamonas aquatica]